jgi:hypothetical protein
VVFTDIELTQLRIGGSPEDIVKELDPLHYPAYTFYRKERTFPIELDPPRIDVMLQRVEDIDEHLASNIPQTARNKLIEEREILIGAIARLDKEGLGLPVSH